MVGLVDEWAARFFEELDYVNEGENGMLFSEMMKKDLPQVNLLAYHRTYYHGIWYLQKSCDLKSAINFDH